VGFRAPAHAELVSEFLQRHAETIAERGGLRGLYADPGLRLQKHAAAIPPGMIDATQALMDKLTFSRADIARFLGEYLTEPKARVVFDRPRPALSRARFAAALHRHGAQLDARTIMLFNGSDYFVNGERISAGPALRGPLTMLADERALPGRRRSGALCDLLHDWYVAGWLHPDEQ
jgi:50S ribosomal protein L16 3-hydroxylase